MAKLSPASAAAINRLRAYTPPPTNYYSLPLTRRAAVLILLYTDRQGELRVVLTMRAKTLSSYAGQAALPGGKADTLEETPTQTARREAFEEIGLPISDAHFPSPFRIHNLCQLPMNLAATQLGVRPCVAWIEADPNLMSSSPSSTTPPTKFSSPSQSNSRTATVIGPSGRITRSMATRATDTLPNVEDVLIPRLDAKEVAAVFTAPFSSFLHTHSPTATPPTSPSDAFPTSTWYSGQWTHWQGAAWRMHNFYVPSSDQPVAWAEPPATTMTMNRFRVFGMTARILVDAARVAYGREPDFEHNSHFGDEDMIGRLVREGMLGDRVKRGDGGVGVVDGKGEDGEKGKGEHGSKM